MTASLRETFIAGMSRAATTVNVVTTDGPAGRAGVTVSAMSSVSADGEAPTLLVCVHHLAPAAQTILANGCFVVNLLRDDQSYISDTFAGRLKRPDPNGADADKFACTQWVAMQSGAPRVQTPLVAFDCTVQSASRVGTHHIFIGQVVETHLPAPGTALLYANRAYSAPARLLTAQRMPTTGTIKIGCLATFGPWLLPAILRSLEDAAGPPSGPINLDLHEGDQRHLLELLREGTIDLAFLYDFGLGGPASGITRLPIADLAPYVLLPADDPLSALPEIPIATLLARRMVLLDAPPSRDYFLSLFAPDTPRISYRAKSFEMVRGMVAHGLGFSLLATKPASPLSYDGKPLITRPLAGSPAKSRLVLCGRAQTGTGATHAPETEAFILHTANIFGLDLE